MDGSPIRDLINKQPAPRSGQVSQEPTSDKCPKYDGIVVDDNDCCSRNSNYSAEPIGNVAVVVAVTEVDEPGPGSPYKQIRLSLSVPQRLVGPVICAPHRSAYLRHRVKKQPSIVARCNASNHLASYQNEQLSCCPARLLFFPYHKRPEPVASKLLRSRGERHHLHLFI